MKVAFIGAPTAGKTITARRVTRRLNDEFGAKSWTIIDGYVDRLRARTKLPFGVVGDFQEHLQVMAERWTLEAEAEAKEQHAITCGSIYESIIYAAVPPATAVLNEQGMVEEHTYYQTMLGALGALEQQTFNYDALFYLPWRKPSAEQSHTWEAVIDAKIPEVLEGYFKYATVLDGTDRQRVDRATDVIRHIIKAQTSEDDQQAV